MSNVKITLLNAKGVETSYTANKVKARVLKSALQLASKADKNELDEVGYMDEMVALIVQTFNRKEITEDTIYDGVLAEDFMRFLQDTLMQIMGGVAPDEELTEGK